MGKDIKLNLGCGKRLEKDFINVDSKDFKQKGFNFVKADVRKLPFKDNYADYIIAPQVLEHLPMKDVVPALKEWTRVLKPKGKIVITVPNFNDLAQSWINEMGEKIDLTRYLTLAQHIYGNQFHEGEFHHTPFTPHFMQFILTDSGLKSWKIFAYPAMVKAMSYDGLDEVGRVYAVGQIHVTGTK
jgi:ubiquinone/menaquinone biosynthesis C-methylase UbiE